MSLRPLFIASSCASLLLACGGSGTNPAAGMSAGGATGGGGTAGETTASGERPDFSLTDMNQTSPTTGMAVSPRDYLKRVSAWYFAHAT